jgi:hypothetical protein
MSDYKFRDDMRSAPRDGKTSIEVRHGARQEIALARWSHQAQAWIRTYDPLRRVLQRVTGWRPKR